MQDWIVPGLAGVVALVALGLAVALARSRSRTESALADARAETAVLREQLASLERRIDQSADQHADEQGSRPPHAETSYVITDLGQQHTPAGRPQPEVGTALFADLVLRETVVKAAGLAHGVRRALDVETRHRIRFEMRREVKRARKQRKADTREARREWEARQRSALDGEDAA